MWNTRKEAMEALETSLKDEAHLIYEGFDLIDEMIQMLYDPSIPMSFLAICGLVLLKGRTLSQGMFSLALDGLAQESGALLRPTIECFELLEYFRKDPKRIEEAIEDRLPRAGQIAKKINENLKKLRDYLNKNASHFSLTPGAMLHLINWRNGNVKLKQLYMESVLKRNLETLFLILLLLSSEAAKCLNSHGCLCQPILDRFNRWRENDLKTITPQFKDSI